MTGSVHQRRIKVLKKILSIKVGPGAVSLPANISKIHLVFAKNNYTGNNAVHQGAKKFWRAFLPQIKYHNPDVPMIVERLEEPSCPATLTIYHNSRTLSTSSQSENSSTTLENKESLNSSDPILSKVIKKEINMKGRTHTKILDNFLELTKAKSVSCSEKDLQDIQWVERASENSIRDANIMKVHNEKRKRQEEMLSAAKGVTA